MKFPLFLKPHPLTLQASKISNGNIKANNYKSGKCEEKDCYADEQTGRHKIKGCDNK